MTSDCAPVAGDANVTQVTQSFFRGTSPRVYVDSAPHNVEDADLTLSGWRAFYSSLRWRHVGNYRLDELDSTIRASGLGLNPAVPDAETKKIFRFFLERTLLLCYSSSRDTPLLLACNASL